MTEYMITYERALSILSMYGFAAKEGMLPLPEAYGHVLAEDIKADRSFPPFDRVGMDGIAVQSRAFDQGRREFLIEGIAPAGAKQRQLINKEHCLEVMTGAILPKNTDTVVPCEDISFQDGKALLQSSKIEPRQNIHAEASDAMQGDVLLSRGTYISSAEVAILAAVGKVQVKVFQLPRTIIVSTGDELVLPEQRPKPFQIRDSNAYAIKSILETWGICAQLTHLKDDKESMLQEALRMLEAYEVLIFSGGISKGKCDYLPEVLAELQMVESLFSKVKQRPGKPFCFAKTNTGKYIFALPGNPVSSFACIWIYFRHWLLSSLQVQGDWPCYAVLKHDVEFLPELTYFLEAKVRCADTGLLEAFPKAQRSSGNVVKLGAADGFLILPREKNVFQKGEAYPFIFYRRHM